MQITIKHNLDSGMRKVKTQIRQKQRRLCLQQRNEIARSNGITKTSRSQGKFNST